MQLVAAISIVFKELPKSQQTNPEQTDAANKRLVDMETQVFKLVHQGKAPDALKIVLGQEYTGQEKIYQAGIRGTLKTIDDNTKLEIQSYQQSLLLSAILALSSLVIGSGHRKCWDSRPFQMGR